MALTLQVLHKGEPASYWAVLESRSDYIENTTRVVLGLYRNEASYSFDKRNALERKTVFLQGVDFTLEQLYPELIKPVPVEVSPAIEEILEEKDEEGTIIRPYQAPADAVYAESNPFAVVPAEPANAAEEKTQELAVWSDTFWTEYYRVKTKVEAGDATAEFKLESVGPAAVTEPVEDPKANG